MTTDYQRIEQAIRYIEQQVHKQPCLDDIAAYIGLSPFHFQRLFRHWAGVSPKRFLGYLTVEQAKKKLRHAGNILDTAHELGLSSPGRLHDQFITIEAVTPGQYKSKGEGLTISYGLHSCPLGGLFMAITPRGICQCAFVEHEGLARELRQLQKTWPNAVLIRDDTLIEEKAAALIHILNANVPQPLHLAVKGTNFQVNVWRALLKIPYGALLSYKDLAEQAGCPDAIRAAASAVAANPVAFLIPCHRVLRTSGEFGKYHWGMQRKKILVAWEASRLQNNNETIPSTPQKNASTP